MNLMAYQNSDGEITIQLESIEERGWFHRQRCYSFSIVHQNIRVGYVDYRTGLKELFIMPVILDIELVLRIEDTIML